MKTGLNRWCLPGELSLRECFVIAGQAGFDGLEINMEEEETKNLNLHLDSPRSEVQQIGELAFEAGLEIPALATGLFWKYSLTAEDQSVRERAADIVRHMIDAAAELGADTVLVVPGQVTEEVSYEEAYERAREGLFDLRGYAEKRQVTIGIENVWNKFLLSPLEMKKIIDEIDSPRVGAYFDVGNVLAFSYPKHWIDILNSRISKVHVKDFHTEVGNIQGFTSLLAGDVNWPQVIKKLREVGYDDYLTAELSPYQHCPEQLVRETKGALDQIIEL